tara:strand:- start:163 stop:1170 length:1008 start_codon:yes stop_codon:yes gene_type:complete
MKKIYLLVSVFTIIFTSCDTDFDVNAEWEEVTVVYGLLDAGDYHKTQLIKINKAFLGKMDALQIAQYADSINFNPNNLDVNIYRIKNGSIVDSIALDTTILIKDSLSNNGEPGIFSIDNNIIYTFENDNFLNSNSEYEILIKNNITDNEVSSTTNIISGFNFDMRSNFKFGFIQTWVLGNPSATKFSNTSVRWGNSTDNGQQYQIDLIFNYQENNVSKSLVYTTPVLEGTSQYEFDGEQFFNFLKGELAKDPLIFRKFIDIDLVMTVGSDDLKTYRLINEEITGIVLERPQFTNISNGVGLFSSRFTKNTQGFKFTNNTIDYLISIDGLDRNFTE